MLASRSGRSLDYDDGRWVYDLDGKPGCAAAAAADAENERRLGG